MLPLSNLGFTNHLSIARSGEEYINKWNQQIVCRKVIWYESSIVPLILCSQWGLILCLDNGCSRFMWRKIVCEAWLHARIICCLCINVVGFTVFLLKLVLSDAPDSFSFNHKWRYNLCHFYQMHLTLLALMTIEDITYVIDIISEGGCSKFLGRRHCYRCKIYMLSSY